MVAPTLASCGRALVYRPDARGSALGTEHRSVTLDVKALAGYPAHRLDEQRTLGDLDPLVQRYLVVVLGNRHRNLGENRAGVHAVANTRSTPTFYRE